MDSKDYLNTRDKIYLLRDEGKFLQAIETAQLFSQQLQQDLSITDIKATKEFIKEYLCSTYYIEGAMLRQIRNYFQSDIVLYKGLAIAEEIKDIKLIARIYSALANNKFQNGYLEQTLELLQKGYEVIKDSTHYVEKVMIQGNIGQTLNTLGEFDSAEHIISTMVSEIEKLGMVEYLGNAYLSLGEYKFNQGLFKDALFWYRKSIENFTEMKKHRNLYFITIQLIKTYIQLGEIETAEQYINELTKIEYEGKGDKEELEKLLLFIFIFIARKEFTIAKYSLDTITVSLESDEMVEYKALFMFQRSVIHCLEFEFEKTLELVDKINKEEKYKQYIMYKSQLTYLQSWSLLQLNRINEAKEILENSFQKSKGRLLVAGMFYLPKEILNYFKKEQIKFKEKQQS